MKITRIETIVLNLPMRIDGATPMLGGRARTSIDMLLVRIDTDAGITGWGEAFGHRIFPATRAAIDTLLGPLCVGRDASQIAALNDDLQRVLHGVGRNGATIYALSGIDIALWDIAGKAAGLPLYRLLGGSRRDDLPAYASLLRYGTAAAVAHYTEQALGRGYRHLKLHEITVPEVKAARDAAGADVPIMVDTNCPWTVAEAIAMAHWLAPFDLHWLEEPVWPPENLAGLAEVRARGGIDTAAGENYGTVWDFRRAFEAGAITYAQPSVTKIGGVTEMRKVITLAEAFGAQVVPHSAYFGPGLLASIHCIAAMPTPSIVERFYCDFADNPLGDAIHPKNGRIAVPQGPGLGVDPDPRMLEKLADELDSQTAPRTEDAMKVATWRGEVRFTIDDAPDPVPGPGQAVVAIHAAGICGTDVHATQGLFPWKPPMVLGHEYTGVVQSVGRGVSRRLVGRAVACEPSYGCGACAECTEGRISQCPRATRVGGFAERVALPAANLHPLPRGLDPLTAAMTEPAACCLANVEMFRMPRGASVLVIGGGIMGLLTMALARRRGARKLILSDPIDERRAMAKRLGASAVVDPTRENLRDRVHELTRGRGVDVVCEAVGKPALVAEALTLVRPKGIVQLVGVNPKGSQLPLDLWDVHFREITIHGAFGRGGSFRRALAVMPKLRVKSLVTAKFPLDRIEEAFAHAAAGRGVKTMITPAD